MKIKQLIETLLNFPMNADLVIDTEDGLRGNYQEVKNVYEKKTANGESFIVLSHGGSE